MFNRFWPLLVITPPISMILGYFLAAAVTFFMPKRYESTAVIEIVSQNTPVDIVVEMRKLTSSDNLALVTHNIDLSTRWGVDHESCLRLLGDSVFVRPIPGTNLIEIRASSIHREDARDITDAVIYAYCSIREGYDLETIERTLHQLQMEIIELNQTVYKLHQGWVARGRETLPLWLLQRFRPASR